MEYEFDKPVYTVKEFIKAYPMCEATFYKLIKLNQAPKLMRIASKIYITKESALEWQRSMEK